MFLKASNGTTGNYVFREESAKEKRNHSYKESKDTRRNLRKWGLSFIRISDIKEVAGTSFMI
jgi:hypothetical protein